MKFGETPVTLTNGIDYTIGYENNVNAGTATLTITGKGGYTGTLTKEYMIAPKAVTPTVTLSRKTYVYDGKVKKPAAKVRAKVGSATKTLKAGTDYNITYKNNKKAGKATATIRLKGNYSGSKAATYTIKPKKQVKVTMKKVNGKKYYGAWSAIKTTKKVK